MRAGHFSFRPLPLGAIQPSGWMLAQIRGDLNHGFAGRLDSLTERAATDLFAKRIESSDQQFAWWDSETRGNWLWGYTMLAHLGGRAEHRERVEALLLALRNTQDPDGYLGIYSPASRYNHGDGENGELWAQSRALLALLAQYEFSGHPAWLESAERAARLTLRRYGPGRTYFRRPSAYNDLTGVTHGLCYADVVEWLYAITGDPAYRDFAVWLYDDFSALAAPFPNDDLALPQLLNPGRPLQGHAVHTAEHLRALLFAHQAAGRPDLAAALQSALRKLRLYSLPSGALLGDESLHGLATPDAGYEYCTLTELLFSLSSALAKLGDPALGDWMEDLAFNAGQGARLPDGSGLSYLTADTRLDASAARPDSYSSLHGKHGRFKFSPTHEDVACCCNPNAVRFLPHYISRMWMRTEDPIGLAALAYGPAILRTRVDGVDVAINQQAEYPFANSLAITVETGAPVHFALILRRPAWASRVDLQQAEAREEGGFLIIEKTWQGADGLTVAFQADPQAVPYPNGEYAVRRGPLLYALPLEGRRATIKDYPLPDFHDYEIHLADVEAAYDPLFLDAALPGCGLEAHSVRPITADHLLNPWANPPVYLQAGGRRLLPLGATLLRRAAFPLKNAASQPPGLKQAQPAPRPRGR
jgi:DUF1680 family protein